MKTQETSTAEISNLLVEVREDDLCCISVKYKEIPRTIFLEMQNYVTSREM